MDTSQLEQEFEQKICAKISITPQGYDRYRVVTPFLFDDGDHLVIILRRIGEQWIFTDEGNTFMHLTYDLDEKDFRKGTRQSIIDQTLAMFSVSDRDGELVLEILEDAFGDGLYNFIQAQLKISDLTFLSRERIFSTFLQDFRLFMSEKIPSERRTFDWHDPRFDPKATYPVDIRVNNNKIPTFIYAINGDTRARDVTISLLQFERWGLQFHSVAVFENQEEINRQVLARFSDVCEKQFSSLESNKDRLAKYLESVLS